MIRKNTFAWFIGLVAVLSPATGAAVSGENPGTLSIVPDQIRIGAFYHGTELQISANVD